MGCGDGNTTYPPYLLRRNSAPIFPTSGRNVEKSKRMCINVAARASGAGPMAASLTRDRRRSDGEPEGDENGEAPAYSTAQVGSDPIRLRLRATRS